MIKAIRLVKTLSEMTDQRHGNVQLGITVVFNWGSMIWHCNISDYKVNRQVILMSVIKCQGFSTNPNTGYVDE